jgi:hypothetical protein
LHGTVLAVRDRWQLVGMTFLDQLTSGEVPDAAYEWAVSAAAGLFGQLRRMGVPPQLAAPEGKDQG